MCAEAKSTTQGSIDSPDADHEKTRAMILECANQKYQAVSKGRANFDKLEQNLGNADLQILSPAGKPVWSVATLRSILTNEKYKGDALLQKNVCGGLHHAQIKKER